MKKSESVAKKKFTDPSIEKEEIKGNKEVQASWCFSP
jgi:hypothetical protein